ncbi:IPTL-CTERM sorting domain-containing protein [Acidovorax sp. Leaf78]|uniref:IPTL-CTERM sorting domain-containing protein n=1 Tax=Acidovorax sp. Leaf78 TaxID=1736237 RepID=UPI0006FE7730|nr:IPTL-CTERM sorting domain-containing protein [Acidovorax sp. Leaf78]KQO14264.1 hypothetical protein ASF16_18570 [Acidovorax sp. Leaf78]
MTSNDGLPGVAPGGGGGGGYDLGNRAGGAGGAGQVRMTFTVAAMAAPAAIPTLQVWGAGLLSTLLALAAWGTLRKKT